MSSFGVLSLRFKFLMVMGLLLVISGGVYLAMTIHVFKSDKEAAVFDFNRNVVASVSADVEERIRQVSDTMEMYAILSQGQSHVRLNMLEMLERNSDIVHVSAQRLSGEGAAPESYFKTDFLDLHEIEIVDFEKSVSSLKEHYASGISAKAVSVFPLTPREGVHMLGLLRPVIETDMLGKPKSQWIVIGILSTDRFLEKGKAHRDSEMSLSTLAGDEVVSLHEGKLMDKGAWHVSNQNALAINSARGISASLQTLPSGERYLEAIASGKYTRVVVRTPEDRAFGVISKIVRRSVLFSGFVLTIVFLAAILLAQSLTRPIEQLTEGMARVSSGDLETRLQVTTRDEISTLTTSFNTMIQDLKKSREDLNELNRILEKKVEDRTRELEERNRVVKETQEALLKTTRLASVGEVAGRAAHEVLNPLTSILNRVDRARTLVDQSLRSSINFLDQLVGTWKVETQDGGLEKVIAGWKQPSEVLVGKNLWEEDLSNVWSVTDTLKASADSIRKDMDFVHSESQRISRIVDKMRSLSSTSVIRENLSASELVHESLDIMTDLLEKYRIRVVIKEPDLDPTVYVDKDEFVQTVTNLVRNSLHSIRERGQQWTGVLTVSFSQEAGKICIDIEDNGMGISAENQKRLFESQFTTKSKEQGTGLGLSIGRRFMRAAGGDLRLLSSTANAGAIFRIELPLVQVKGAAA
ncbi:MAG: HAMP domain-containing protein [Bdellovibrionales bacterium]|nr:HAMP domain-containing protein [Bdellovibrionales bacterium]